MLSVRGGLKTTPLTLLLGLSFLCSAALAQSEREGQEPVGVVEIGNAPSWNFGDPGSSSLAPTVALEVTPVKDWLELEIGTTSSFSRHSAEWSSDFLFKKPWDLTEKIEFMIGVGPSWVHTRENGIRTNAVAGEFVLDFMFWPNAKRKIGWYLEPSYDYSFRASHEHCVGVSIGILFGLHRREHSN